MGFAIAVHGGAGLIARHSLTAAREEACRAGLHTAVVRGQAILAAGGSALDAVVEAAKSLEDDPLFNAGRGGVLNAEGFVEMDAALMQGMDRTAGAITCATTIRNPILGARAVLEDGRHVLLSGAGADDFGAHAHLPLAEPGYFITPARAEQLEKMKAANASGDSDSSNGTHDIMQSSNSSDICLHRHVESESHVSRHNSHPKLTTF